MSRLARCNKTKWIKLWKKRGYLWRRGRRWHKCKWALNVPINPSEPKLIGFQDEELLWD